jgi:hypothetical protein
MKKSATCAVAQRCADTVIGELPERTEVVVLLGNEEKYVNACFELIRSSRGQVERLNPVAYRSKNVLFVYAIQAGAQGSLVPDWLNGLKSQTEKRDYALDAVKSLSASAAVAAA